MGRCRGRNPGAGLSSIYPHHCELFPYLRILYSAEFVGQELMCAWPDYLLVVIVALLLVVA